jgi:integrase
VLRTHGRPVRKAAALTLKMLRQILATCDASVRGRRDRALLLFGFVGAVRRSELVSLHVEDVAVVPGGLRLRIRRGKTDQAGQGAEIGLPRGRFIESCPVRAFAAWQAVAKRKAGPLFRKISTGDGIREAALHPDAVRRILAHRVAMAGLTVEGFERLSAHALRVGFITEAYDKGVRDEDIMRHTRHRDLRTMRGYVQRAGLVSESPAGQLDLCGFFPRPGTPRRWRPNRRRSRRRRIRIRRNRRRNPAAGARPPSPGRRRAQPARPRIGSTIT